jgi:hypothetical protein
LIRPVKVNGVGEAWEKEEKGRSTGENRRVTGKRKLFTRIHT